MNDQKHFTSQITLDEMHDEIKREITLRQRVYPQWISTNRISRRTADFRLLILEAIQIHLESEIKKTAPQGDLFQ